MGVKNANSVKSSLEFENKKSKKVSPLENKKERALLQKMTLEQIDQEDNDQKMRSYIEAFGDPEMIEIAMQKLDKVNIMRQQLLMPTTIDVT